METINIPHKISTYTKTDKKPRPDWRWTSKSKTEWRKVTAKLRPVLNNLDHDIYICCYSSTTGYMTTKPGREGNDK